MTLWNRRQLLKGAGMTAALCTLRTPLAAQWPRDEEIADAHLALLTSTADQPWQKTKILKPSFSFEALNLNLDPSRKTGKAIEGFGACFNELGWKALEILSEAERESVLRELFDPQQGARLNYCRMPIGVNDFSVEAYSYDEQEDDFALAKFSIDHDKSTLIPFIHAAQKHRPDLRLWASPWTPPTWMKRNRFYAEAAGRAPFKENGIRPDQIGHEGEDFFIQDARYFDAYARYFGRFIDAYRSEGINVGMVMPQNEFNSAQNFPSCTWTPEGLARFIRVLGPEMKRRDVALFFGTLERGNPAILEAVMHDPDAARYIKGMGVQWAGKNALPRLQQEFPGLAVFQSEQECGDGSNSWQFSSYCWHLMKHYFRSGAVGYMYWNIALEEGVASTWGWSQNSLVTVNRKQRSFRFTHDYVLLKHLTHFVERGARVIETSGSFDDALSFINPDGSVVALLRNEAAHPQRVAVRCGSVDCSFDLPADSIATMHMMTV